MIRFVLIITLCLCLATASPISATPPNAIGSPEFTHDSGDRPGGAGRLDDGGDNCTDAEEIVNLPYCDSGSTEERADDVTPICGGTGGSDVFYRYTPSADGLISVALCGSEFNTVLEVWEGCPYLGGTRLGCSDDDCEGLESCLSGITVFADVTYFILIDAYNQFQGGGYMLTVREGDVACPFQGCDPVIDCDDISACEGPEEVEPNDSCPDMIDFNILGCQSEVNGVFCPETDRDVYLWEIPAHTYASVELWDGEGCVLPGFLHAFTLYDENCNTVVDRVTESAVINETDFPINYYIDVDMGDLSPYRLLTECCPVTDYCLSPVLIPDTSHYESTLLTCCATHAVSAVWTWNCQGDQRVSGRSIVHSFTLTRPRYVNLWVEGLESNQDEQVMIFTDCQDPLGSCLASDDDNTHTIDPETIEDLLLGPGSYYISTSYFHADSCGEMLLIYDTAIPPVEELTIRGDTPGGATLYWITPWDGTDHIYSTTVPNNDGDPDAGTDPDWILEDSVPVTMGAASWQDPAALGDFKSYVVLHED